VPWLVSWGGKVKVELRKGAPKTGYVADSKTWKKLWNAWRAKEQAPHVNFKEAIILVGVSEKPNQIMTTGELDDKGDLLLRRRQGPPLVGQPAGDEAVVGGQDLGRRVSLGIGPRPEGVVLLVEAP
jgi:hypothetical protein